MLRRRGRTQEGKPSEHTKEATARRVYLVVEFNFTEFADDGVTATEWGPLIRQCRSAGVTVADICAGLHLHLSQSLPLVAAVYSGGKSVHGWYPAFGHSESQLREFMSNFMNEVLPLTDSAPAHPAMVHPGEGRVAELDGTLVAAVAPGSFCRTVLCRHPRG